MAGLRADIVQAHPFRVREGRVEHLVLRRSHDEELMPGIWQVVTGGTHDGESAVDAARREVAEETGLEPFSCLVTGQVATFYFEPFDAVVLSPIIACEMPADVEPTLSDEHAEHRWLVAADAVTLLAFTTQRDGVGVVEELLRSGSRADLPEPP